MSSFTAISESHELQSPSGDATEAFTPVFRAIGERVRTAGKFFFAGDQKFLVRGVTYGPFKPEADGGVYHTPEIVSRDFAMMAKYGINSIRIYTAPPRWLLDLASEHRLRVMAGVPWSQHVAFLDHKPLIKDAYDRVAETVEVCANHPAMLGITIGNEIPGPIVRWYGHQKIEKHLCKLHQLVKSADRDLPVTYANYPTTEYLDLPFLDFVSFNVYLDAPDRFDAYLARLQNIAGERPLIMSEIGMDSVYYGEPTQAAMLTQKIDACFGGGCAGMFVFSWTDEWFRHGEEIDQWRFGLVDRHRVPRESLEAVSTAFLQTPFVGEPEFPKASVVICSYNGSRTIAESIRHALNLDYPDFEVIVVDDGSTDAVSEIASRFPVKLIRQDNQGLSVARNVGWQNATGEIVAYLDDDAYPDPHWLKFLAKSIKTGGYVGAGGPNLAVPEDGEIAECVAHSPGGPTHVLLSDTVAEHIPGCNMAFLRSALAEIGGFDPQFRIAGDDVDICWRLQEMGGELGFSPVAQVWHHRRNSVKAFWKQQVNYGKAEADLERKWPQKYNAIGHATWSGRLYGKGSMQILFGSRRRIYHGVWGEALFQQVYHIPPGPFASLPMMPEWYFLLAMLAGVSLVGIVWWPMLLAVPLLVLLVTFSFSLAMSHALRASLVNHADSKLAQLRMRLRIALLYRMQPLARLIGRYSQGLTPWRPRGVSGFATPVPRTVQLVKQKWKLSNEWLSLLESSLRRQGALISRGSDFDRWDLELRGGLAGAIRMKLMTEDLGDQKQLVRWRAVPSFSSPMLVIVSCIAGCAMLATAAHHPILGCVFGLAFFAVLIWVIREAGAAMKTFVEHVSGEGDS